LIVFLFILNCVVIIILPLAHAPLASPLYFFFWGGGSAEEKESLREGRHPHAPPGYASACTLDSGREL